jgi:hypothetical protein
MQLIVVWRSNSLLMWVLTRERSSTPGGKSWAAILAKISAANGIISLFMTQPDITSVYLLIPTSHPLN